MKNGGRKVGKAMLPVTEITAPVTALKSGGTCTLTTKQSVDLRLSISDKTAMHGMGLRNFKILLNSVAPPNELAFNAAMIKLGLVTTANKVEDLHLLFPLGFSWSTSHPLSSSLRRVLVANLSRGRLRLRPGLLRYRTSSCATRCAAERVDGMQIGERAVVVKQLSNAEARSFLVFKCGGAFVSFLSRRASFLSF